MGKAPRVRCALFLRLQCHLSCGDHLLSGRDSLQHHYVLALPLAKHNLTKLYRGVGLDDVDKRAFLANLSRLARNQHCVFSRVQYEPDVHELAGP